MTAACCTGAGVSLKVTLIIATPDRDGALVNGNGVRGGVIESAEGTIGALVI